MQDYAYWNARLGKRQSLKVLHNTYCQRRYGGDIAIRLHATDVVTFHKGGKRITVNHNGWTGPTTARRIDDFALGLRRTSFRGTWTVKHYTDKGFYNLIWGRDPITYEIRDGLAYVINARKYRDYDSPKEVALRKEHAADERRRTKERKRAEAERAEANRVRQLLDPREHVARLTNVIERHGRKVAHWIAGNKDREAEQAIRAQYPGILVGFKGVTASLDSPMRGRGTNYAVGTIVTPDGFDPPSDRYHGDCQGRGIYFCHALADARAWARGAVVALEILGQVVDGESKSRCERVRVLSVVAGVQGP